LEEAQPNQGDLAEFAQERQTEKRRCVTFSESPPLVVEEDPALGVALREARRSDHMQRLADRARAEQLLGPVLESGHRAAAIIRMGGTFSGARSL